MTIYVVASGNIRHALPAAKFTEDVSTVLGVPGLDLAGFQECSGADRRRALDALSDRYGVGLTNLDPYQTPVVRSSRFVLVEEFRWHLTRRTKVGPAGAGPRFMSAKWAVVQVLTDTLTGRTVAHANAHLVPSIFLPIRRRLHRRQITRLAELTTHLLTAYPGAHVFVGGDFNATPTKPRGWAEPLREAGLVHGGRSTIPTHESGRSIDHIFSTVPLVDTRVLRGANTDHRPIVVTFETAEEETVPIPADVRQRGTDTSGRPIYATDLMWSWWEARCYDLGFVPTITQGAWMVLAGGGADASAGYHDGGGCFDLRVWDRTDAEVDAMIANLRANGAAAWLRNIAHGGFTDAHIHFVLRADAGLSNGAAWQWLEYLDARDGLASRGPDYHPRPAPLVRVPPKGALMPTADEIARAVWSEQIAVDADTDIRARVMLAQIHKRTGDTRTLAKQLKDAGLPVDEATIEAAIRKVFGALDEAQP